MWLFSQENKLGGPKRPGRRIKEPKGKKAQEGKLGKVGVKLKTKKFAEGLEERIKGLKPWKPQRPKKFLPLWILPKGIRFGTGEPLFWGVDLSGGPKFGIGEFL